MSWKIWDNQVDARGNKPGDIVKYDGKQCKLIKLLYNGYDFLWVTTVSTEGSDKIDQNYINSWNLDQSLLGIFYKEIWVKNIVEIVSRSCKERCSFCQFTSKSIKNRLKRRVNK